MTTGIKNVMCKYIENGSLKGTWRIYAKEIKWRNNSKLQNKMKKLFIGFDKKELNNYSGNGGNFSIFVIVK